MEVIPDIQLLIRSHAHLTGPRTRENRKKRFTYIRRLNRMHAKKMQSSKQQVPATKKVGRLHA